MQQKPSDQQRAAVAAKLHDSLKYTFAKISNATGFEFTVGKPKQVGSGFEYTFQVHAFANLARMEEAAKDV
jgi:hypothetical protein